MDLNELQSLNIRELSKLAQKLNIDGGIAGLNRQALIVKILEANEKNDGSFSARGVLEVMQDGYGFLRSPDFNYMPGPDDIYVSSCFDPHILVTRIFFRTTPMCLKAKSLCSRSTTTRSWSSLTRPSTRSASVRRRSRMPSS